MFAVWPNRNACQLPGTAFSNFQSRLVFIATVFFFNKCFQPLPRFDVSYVNQATFHCLQVYLLKFNPWRACRIIITSTHWSDLSRCLHTLAVYKTFCSSYLTRRISHRNVRIYKVLFLVPRKATGSDIRGINTSPCRRIKLNDN